MPIAFSGRAACFGEGYDPWDCLPAWRWNNTGAAGFVSAFSTGWRDALGDVPVKVNHGLGGTLFAFAAAVWGVLLWFMKQALTVDILRTAHGPINDGYRIVATTVLGTPLWGAVFVTGFAFILFQGMKKGFSFVFRSLIGLVLPLGLLVVMLQNAQSGPATPMSPGWIAQQSNRMVTGFANSLSSGFTQISFQSDPDAEVFASSCVRFRNSLRSSFRSSEPIYGNMAQQMSLLWEESMLRQWRIAQFNFDGGMRLGEEVDCRVLEVNSDISPDRQYRAAVFAMRGIDQNQNPDAVDGRIWAPFGPYESNSQARRFLNGWLYCVSPDGESWRLRDPVMGGETSRAGDRGRPDGQMELDGRIMGNDSCANWWRGNPDGILNFGDGTGNILGATDDAQTSEQAALMSEIRRAQMGLHGYGTIKIRDGIFALMTVLFMAWGLAGLLVGSIVAGLITATFLVLLPFMLLFFAWPSENSTVLARKMTRLFVGSLAVQVIIVMAMAMFILVMSAMNRLLMPLAAEGGFVGSLVGMLSPIAAIMISRYFLKQMKLGDVTSFKGAMRMSASMGRLESQGSPFSYWKYRAKSLLDPTRRSSITRQAIRSGKSRLGEMGRAGEVKVRDYLSGGANGRGTGSGEFGGGSRVVAGAGSGGRDLPGPSAGGVLPTTTAPSYGSVRPVGVPAANGMTEKIPVDARVNDSASTPVSGSPDPIDGGNGSSPKQNFLQRAYQAMQRNPGKTAGAKTGIAGAVAIAGGAAALPFVSPVAGAFVAVGTGAYAVQQGSRAVKSAIRKRKAGNLNPGGPGNGSPRRSEIERVRVLPSGSDGLEVPERTLPPPVPQPDRGEKAGVVVTKNVYVENKSWSGSPVGSSVSDGSSSEKEWEQGLRTRLRRNEVQRSIARQRRNWQQQTRRFPPGGGNGQGGGRS